jgi:DNA-binding transcriptional ArsR family regulator
MSLAAEFDSPADRYAYAVVSAGAAALSYYHARAFFLPFMGTAGASATPLMLDAVVFWLASACIRQARAGRPLPMLRLGGYAVLALAITANALGGATVWERVFMALPAALFGFLTEARFRLALYHHRAEHGDERLRARLWFRNPVRTFRAWLWLARQSAPAFDRASAERDRLAAARDAVRLALPGRSRVIRRARAGVLRELNAGRLTPAAAVKASGLLTRPGVPELHRAALAAALGASRPPAIRADITPDSEPDTPRTSRRTARTDTRTAVARMRDRHPDMTAADIAARLGVSDRTVRRHLNHPPSATEPVAA